MSDLPANQTCRYGSFDFGATCELIKVDAKNVSDPAGRMRAYTVYTITLATYLLADTPGDGETDGVDDQMDEIRPVLEERGQALRIVNAGLGDFQIQTSLADVKYGPNPLGYTVEQVADRNAWKLTWKCEVAIGGECLSGISGPTSVKGPLWFCYDLRYDIDPSRYTKRTYNCTVRIAGVRADVETFTIADQADRYREQVTPQLPIGFRRLTDAWALSQDKLELTGTVVDEQMPVSNYPPPGVISCRASASSTSAGPQPMRWKNSVEASYEMAAGYSRAYAIKLFLSLLYDRMITAARGNIFPAKIGGTATAPVFAMQPLLEQISISEPEIYGKVSARLSASWWYLTTWINAFKANGLWRPVPGSDWNVWFKSMTASAGSTANWFGPRGSAGLDFSLSDDLLVSLCSGPANPLPGGGSGLSGTKTGGSGSRVTTAVYTDELASVAPEVLAAVGLGSAPITPANSWISYDLEVRIEPVDDVAEMKLLPAKPVARLPSPTSSGDTTGYKVRYVQPSVPTHIVQTRAYPSVYITLTGRALRAGYEITPPELMKVGNITPVACNKEGLNFVRSRVRGFLTAPVTACSWSLRWLLAGVPNVVISTPDNPMYGGIATSGSSGGGLSGSIITTTD